MQDGFEAQLDQLKQQSTAQLLMQAARRLNEHAIGRLREQSKQPGLRAAHTSLLPHIDLEGTRLTVVAERMGVSKQAVGQLVDEMEEVGVLERVADPTDRRAKLIRFTRSGRRWLLKGLAVLGEVESDLQAEMGERQMRALHRSLEATLQALERWGA